MKSALTHWADLEAARDDSSMNLKQHLRQHTSAWWAHTFLTSLKARLNALIG